MVKLVVVLMLVWCCCGACMVLVQWCAGGGWSSGMWCGGKWRPINIKPHKPHFSLEGGNCCPNFDSTLVVFYMLTPLSINSLTLSVIYQHLSLCPVILCISGLRLLNSQVLH